MEDYQQETEQKIRISCYSFEGGTEEIPYGQPQNLETKLVNKAE